jgi:hypothetical protein
MGGDGKPSFESERGSEVPVPYPVAHLVSPPSWQSHPDLVHPPRAYRISAESRPLEAPNFGLVRAEKYGLV